MKGPIELQPGDPCPGCGGTLVKAPQPSDAQRAAAANTKDADRWVPLPPHYDTAPLSDIAELGELWRCPGCGYPHRFKPAAAATAAK